MTGKQFTEDCTKKEETKPRKLRAVQVIMLTALALFWIGYFYELYRGNDRNMSQYSILILALTLLNSDLLLAGKKTEHRALNMLGGINAVLVCVCAAIMIIQVVLK